MGERRINLPVVIVLIIVFAALSGFGIYYHQKIYIPRLEEDIKNAQVEVRETGPQKSGSRTLLAELKENSIQLYRDGDYVILVHDGQETEFSDWHKEFGRRTPEIYYYDFIGDGKDDIVIRAFEGEDEATGEALYGFYVLSVSTDYEGKHSYVVNYTNDAGWSSEFNERIKCYVNQLTKSPKRIQFVMAYAGKTISFDNETGIAVSETPVSYICAPIAPSGERCTLKSWYMGPCVINIDKKTHNITVDITIYFTYNETDKIQTAGTIKTGLTYRDGKFVIAEKSIYFEHNNEVFATPPVRDEIADWSMDFSPTGSYTDKKVISNLALECMFNHRTNESLGFKSVLNLANEAGGVSKISANQNELKIYLKPGYSFSSEVTEIKNIQVTASVLGRMYNVADSAEILTEGSVQVLRIKFDTKYSNSEMSDFKIIIESN